MASVCFLGVDCQNLKGRKTSNTMSCGNSEAPNTRCTVHGVEPAFYFPVPWFALLLIAKCSHARLAPERRRC